jgi:topoisomerase-4 subunit A
LKLTEGALVLPPSQVPLVEGVTPEPAVEGGAASPGAPPTADARVALVNSEGRLLLFAARDVPELPRGKGNKLFGIPTKKAASREETVVAAAVLTGAASLVVSSGDRRMTLTPADLKDYVGERAQRGALLPRGWRTVERIQSA